MYCFERYIVEVSTELIGPLGCVFAYHRPHPKDRPSKTVPLVPGPFPGGGVVSPGLRFRFDTYNFFLAEGTGAAGV